MQGKMFLASLTNNTFNVYHRRPYKVKQASVLIRHYCWFVTNHLYSSSRIRCFRAIFWPVYHSVLVILELDESGVDLVEFVFLKYDENLPNCLCETAALLQKHEQGMNTDTL